MKNTIKKILMIVAMIAVVGCANAQAAVKVAIIDSGCNDSYAKGISFVDGSVYDQNGHGTLMAQIVKEAAPEAELYVIKVVGKEGLVVNEEMVVAGIEWAIAEKVQVINLSLRVSDSARLHAAIRKAHRNGIVIIAAAGNTASKVSTLTSAEEKGLYEVAYPAQYEEVIAVGALNKNGTVMGKTIVDKKVKVYCTGYQGNVRGTSIASAYAAGYAARTMSAHSEYGMQQITTALSQKGGF